MKQGQPEDWLLDDRFLQAQKLAAIGELAAGVGHEINNPLAIIRQEAELMRYLLRDREYLGWEEILSLGDSLGHIIQEVDRAGEIIRRLLDFARKREPVIQGLEVNKLVEDMARLVEKEAQLKNISLVRHYDPDLPMLFSDGPQLRQVILNLLINARDAVEQDGVITITTRHQDGDAAIVIEDTGCGIPPENLDKIFHPFFTTKPPGQGTGLGLSICHGIVQRLGGSIALASQVEKGSVFTVRLPLGLREGVGK
ncbi:MAG: two-component sensor histidine kinase [Deltaproteobacteria bacterium]|nr:two-component sensor histidine kinase [Deltaproteobacteria bacterium]